MIEVAESGMRVVLDAEVKRKNRNPRPVDEGTRKGRGYIKGT